MIECNEAECLNIIQNSVLLFRTCKKVISGMDVVKLDNVQAIYFGHDTMVSGFRMR